ncbi:MAG: LysE family translocator [Deltaproteobacteria bacterium]|nr:MAG: LysE family translocator [Deltaproteobacteria bacterium]
MIPIETVIPFLIASVLLALAPGPDNIFVLTQSAVSGKRAGLAVVFGLCTGLIGHSLAVALGVAVIFQTSALAFSALKFVGAGYLVYLAWKAFHASASRIQNRSEERLSLARLYRRGIFMNITNPKVSIFFLAFLPQFADPARGSIPLQIFQLGGFFILATILVFGSIAVLAGSLGSWLNRSQRTQKILNTVAGIVFLSLAIMMALAKR